MALRSVEDRKRLAEATGGSYIGPDGEVRPPRDGVVRITVEADGTVFLAATDLAKFLREQGEPPGALDAVAQRIEETQTKVDDAAAELGLEPRSH